MSKALPTLSKKKAQALFDAICVTDEDTCTWIEGCNRPAVRLGTFNMPSSKKYTIKFLCENHKQMGMWVDADTAWGWS